MTSVLKMPLKALRELPSSQHIFPSAITTDISHFLCFLKEQPSYKTVLFYRLIGSRACLQSLQHMMNLFRVHLRQSLSVSDGEIDWVCYEVTRGLLESLNPAGPRKLASLNSHTSTVSPLVPTPMLSPWFRRRCFF